MMFKCDIDRCGKREIIKEMKQQEVEFQGHGTSILPSETRQMCRVCVTRDDVKDVKQWKARRAEPGKLSSS